MFLKVDKKLVKTPSIRVPEEKLQQKKLQQKSALQKLVDGLRKEIREAVQASDRLERTHEC